MNYFSRIKDAASGHSDALVGLLGETAGQARRRTKDNIDIMVNSLSGCALPAKKEIMSIVMANYRVGR